MRMIILAAGQGTRMNSELPKVLFPVCQKPMARHVVETLRRAGVTRIILVVGFREELVREEFDDEPDIVTESSSYKLSLFFSMNPFDVYCTSPA